MSTDILFINPGDQKRTYQELSKEFTAIAPPVWTTLLAGFSRKLGYSAAIYDVNVDGWDEQCASEIIPRYNPSLVVMMVYGHQPSASTQTMQSAGRIARHIKNFNIDIPMAMGGTHPSALPEQTLREEAADFIIQGEGPCTIEGLLQWTKGRKELACIPGLWYRENGSVRATEPAPVLKNLDEELGEYAWDLLPELSRYRAHNWHCFQYFEQSKSPDFTDVRSPYAAMNTSLGCPYACSYCCINVLFGKPEIRYWSVEKVISWIDILVKTHHVKNIRLDDELFILSPKRIERFCDLLIERKYELNIFAYARVDTIKENLLMKMKKAGITWLCLGIESAARNVREGVNKFIAGNITNVVKKIQDNGMFVLGNFMFGLPEDSLETMEETLRLALKLNCEFANFYTVMAYPGSQLYKQTPARHLPDNWAGFSQHGYETKPLPTNYISATEVLRFRDAAFQRYYSDENYLFMAEQKFGVAVRKHLEKMVSVKVERKLLIP